MTANVINPGFPDISYVYCYDSEDVLKLTMVKTGTERLSGLDFIETDFKYHQDKLEFFSSDVLNELATEDKETIDQESLSGTEKYLSTLFPTCIPGSPSGNISYFSTSVGIEGDETLCILIPETIKKVKMADSGETDAVEIIFDESETSLSKVLWMVSTYDPTSPIGLNLSFEAYKGDRDPIKKMSDYVLRNDAFVSNFSGTHEEGGYLYSNISSSLIGTEKVENRPIYNLLKGMEGKYWNRSKRYSVGDSAWIGETEYESLEANNIGNHPYYSRMWIKKVNT